MSIDTTLRVQVTGVEAANLNSPGLVEIVDDGYLPKLPERKGGAYDLDSPLEEELRLIVSGYSVDALLDLMHRLEYLCDQIAARRALGQLTELVYAPSGAGVTGRAELIEASVIPQESIHATSTGKYVQEVTFKVKREPVWRGASTALTLSTSPTNNGHLNVGVISGALKGNVPALGKFRVTLGGGTNGNRDACQKVMLGVRSKGAPANFAHLLQCEAATLGTNVALLADNAFSPASGNTAARRTPANGAAGVEALVCRWAISNPNDNFGSFVALLSYCDRATVPNYSYRLRGVVSVNGVYIAGPWMTIGKRMTQMVYSAPATEWPLLSLGPVRFPILGSTLQGVGGFALELWGTPLAADGVLKCDLDYLKLFPIGEAGYGRGLVSAEFGAAVSANRMYFDATPGTESAYLTDGSDVKLISASDMPEGGELWLPAGISGFRVYALACRGASGYFQTDHTMTLGLSGSYTPRYLFGVGSL